MGVSLSTLLTNIYKGQKQFPDAGREFKYYQLWGSLDPDILSLSPKGRPSSASRRKTHSPDKLLEAFGEQAGSKDREDVARYLIDALSDGSEHDALSGGEVSNALGLLVERVFAAAFDETFFGENAEGLPSDLLEDFRKRLAFNFLWNKDFMRGFDDDLRGMFRDVGDAQFIRFWGEYEHLADIPLIPTKVRFDNLTVDEQRAELKRNLVHHLALLMLASIFGPGSYYDLLSLAPPGHAVTEPPVSFGPTRKTQKGRAFLQPVVMVGNGPLDYYTDVDSPRISLDDKSAVYVIGRDPATKEAEKGIVVDASLTCVSRRHAMLRFSKTEGWAFADGELGGEGSLDGPLIVHASGEATLCSGEEEGIAHGDILCLAPICERRLGENLYVPCKNTSGLSFRFEMSD